MNDRWLIALDVDGTILREDGSHSEIVFEEIRRVAALGHLVTLATGRSWETTRPILVELGITPSHVVCSNGALIMARDEDSTDGYRREHIEVFDPSEVLATLQENLPNAHYLVEDADGFRRYTDATLDWELSHGELSSREELAAYPATRVVVVSPDHDTEEFLAIVGRMGLHQVSYSIGWTAWLDIAPAGVNKATAAERVRQWADIPASRVFAAGDGRNDLEMFAWARAEGVAVAMGQAPDEVRTAASQVTGTVDDDGLAEALLRIIR